MEVVLLVVAWGAGLASLFLVADMIMTDIACRRSARRHDASGDARDPAAREPGR